MPAADNPVVKILHFTDNGQDFLRWGLDKKGYVRTCEPFQASIWCGRKVLNHEQFTEGKYPKKRQFAPWLNWREGVQHYKAPLKYAVIKVEIVK